MQHMSDYDRRAWEDLIRARERSLARNPRRLVPAGVRDRVGKAGSTVVDRAKELPAAEQIDKAVRAVMEGGTEGLARLANGSLWTTKILGDYRASGHAIEMVSDIRELELRVVDQITPHLDRRYIAAVAASGAGAGAAITGGELAAVGGAIVGGGAGAVGGGIGAAPGAGVGAAPGTATVLTAMAADAGATVLASIRAIFHIAQYYGYDTNEPDERLRALGVLNVSTAGDAATKQAAYRELDKLANLIVRNATWATLDQNVIGRILHKVLQQQAGRVTKQKLSNLVPVAGIVIGAGFNMRMLSRVTDAADWYYRERFLREKYAITDDESAVKADADEEVVDIPLADIIEEEIALEESGNDLDEAPTWADDHSRDDPPST